MKKNNLRIRTFKIRPTLDDMLREVAKAREMSVSAIIAEAITGYLRVIKTRANGEQWFNDEKGILRRRNVIDTVKRKARFKHS